MMAFRSSAVRSVSSFTFTLRLRASKMWSNFFHVDVQRDFAEHLNEAAIAVVGEARIAALGREALGGLVVQAEVENGVHHAGHRKLRAGPHAEQQRIAASPSFLPICFSSFASALSISCLDFVRHLVAVLEVDVADVGRDGESRRHRQPGARHLGQPGAFAAENVFHRAVAVGRSAAERINVLLIIVLLMNWLRFPKNPRWSKTRPAECAAM